MTARGVTGALALCAVLVACKQQPGPIATPERPAKDEPTAQADASRSSEGPKGEGAAAASRAEGDGVSLTLRVTTPTASGARPAGGGLYDALPAGWQSTLTIVVRNEGQEPLTLPNGKSEGYMVSPTGLELEIRDETGRTWGANPGAGGKTLPVGPQHFTTLAAGAELTCKVPLGRRLPSAEPKAQLWASPGSYQVRARWVGRAPEGPPGTLEEVSRSAPLWSGKTGWAELTFELR